LNFERYFVYELRKEVHLPFQFVLCLTSTATHYRREIPNITFLPLIGTGRYADHDPYRVPLKPGQEGGSRIITRLYVAIDGIQTIGKGAFLPSDLGRITPQEEKEVRYKLSVWLGIN
jgi:hypothetical protein